MGMTRRKWFRRGQAIMDFAIAAISVPVAALLHVVCAAAVAAATAAGSIRRGWRRRRKARKSVATSSAARLSARESTSEVEAKPAQAFKSPSARSTVTFNQVAGLKDAKREISLRAILPLLHLKKARAYGVTTGGGLLLYGPPGCGKTLLAAAVAGELESDQFLHVRPSDIMSNNVGEAERRVASLFDQAASMPRTVLFMDELDSLVPSRRKNTSTIMARVISEFLSQMDGLEKKSARKSADGFFLMIGATNFFEAVDEAFLRPGRFDVKVFVGLPDPSARRQMLGRALMGRSVSDDLDLNDLTKRTDGFSGADIIALVDTAAREAFVTSLGKNTQDNLLGKKSFEAALRSIHPSVSARELKRYEESWKLNCAG